MGIGKRPSQNGLSSLGPKGGSNTDVGSLKSALKRGPYEDDSEGETTTGSKGFGGGVASDEDTDMMDCDVAGGDGGANCRGNKRMRTFDSY